MFARRTDPNHRTTAASRGRRTKVLVSASTYPARSDDGTPGFVRDVACALAAHVDVIALVPRVPGSARTEVDDGVRVERFRYFPRRWEDLANGSILENLRANRSRWIQVMPFLISETWHLWRMVRRERPDVIFVNWLIPQGIASLVAARGVPWIVQTLGGDLYALRDPISKRLKRAIAKRATFVCAMNADMKERLIELGADPERTLVLTMGADVATMRRAARSLEAVPGRIATVGRLVEKKGFHVLLDAVSQLPPGWTLEIAGDGPMRHQLEERAAAMPVRFLGQLSREEVSHTLASAQVLAFPSVPMDNGDQDGLPLALLEGMATGRAIVVSDLPGLADAIRDDIDGLVVEAGGAKALAVALGELLDDGELRTRLGASAEQRADEYGIEATAARYLELITTAADMEAAHAGDQTRLPTTE